MKKLFRFSLVAIVATGLVIAGCKKEEEEPKEEPDLEDGTEQAEMSADESFHNVEVESMVTDANLAAVGAGFNKAATIEGATVIDSLKAQGKITIIYNGKPTEDKLRTKTGTVNIQLYNSNTVKWNVKNAVLKMETKDLKVTRILTGKSVTFNGQLDLTNVLGTLKENSATNTEFMMRGSTTVKFDDATAVTWNVARRITQTKGNGGAYTTTIKGDTTISGKADIVTWGTNRRSEAFYTQISKPIVIGHFCPLKPLSGTKTHTVGTRSASVEFGVDASGNAQTVSGIICPYGFKVSWTTLKGNAKTVIREY